MFNIQLGGKNNYGLRGVFWNQHRRVSVSPGSKKYWYLYHIIYIKNVPVWLTFSSYEVDLIYDICYIPFGRRASLPPYRTHNILSTIKWIEPQIIPFKYFVFFKTRIRFLCCHHISVYQITDFNKPYPNQMQKYHKLDKPGQNLIVDTKHKFNRKLIICLNIQGRITQLVQR